MMESFGLYEDLSLFQGGLLAGVDPLANEFPTLGTDEGHLDLTKFYPSVDLFAEDPAIHQLPKDLANDEDDWMDKKMDLIQLFSSPNVEVTIYEPTSFAGIDLSTILEPLDAFQPAPVEGHLSPDILLENVADLLSVDLGVSRPAAADNLFSGFGESGDFTTDGLTSLLTEEEINALNAPTLSPVSSQDVESILSSGPASPSSLASINDAVVPEFQTIDLEMLANTHSGELSSNVSTEEDYSMTQSAVGPVRSVRSNRGKKYMPYDDVNEEFDKPVRKHARGHRINDRKERKKQQNKDAALRYRQKRKDELSTVFDQCDSLEDTNSELKDKVDGMTREIQYLKDLLLEVFKAKGLQPLPTLISGK